jgi:hypothetical protein
MAQPEVTSMLDNTKAHWQDSEVDLLLQHLIHNQAADGDGRNLMMPTFNSAATYSLSCQVKQTYYAHVLDALHVGGHQYVDIAVVQMWRILNLLFHGECYTWHCFMIQCF